MNISNKVVFNVDTFTLLSVHKCPKREQLNLGCHQILWMTHIFVESQLYIMIILDIDSLEYFLFIYSFIYFLAKTWIQIQWWISRLHWFPWNRWVILVKVKAIPKWTPSVKAQSAWAVEFTDCISAEGLDSSNECPGYYTKQSDDEAPITPGLWGMQSTPLQSSLLGLLLPGMVTPDRVLSMGQIELNCVLMANWIVWNRAVQWDLALGWYAIKPKQTK